MGSQKKKAQMFVKLVSAAGTGFFYVKRKPRQFTEKLEFQLVSAAGIGFSYVKRKPRQFTELEFQKS
ncbi:unnamed protein product [Lathyrus oleraceus]